MTFRKTHKRGTLWRVLDEDERVAERCISWRNGFSTMDHQLLCFNPDDGLAVCLMTGGRERCERVKRISSIIYESLYRLIME